MRASLALVAVLASSLACGPLAAHDWYTGLRNAAGQGCCGGHDCQPIPEGAPVRCGATECTVELPAGAHPTATAAGKYLFRGVPGSSPDERTHVCFVPNGSEQAATPPGYVGVLRCMWFGGGA